MKLKDLMWLLLKDNSLINWCYLSVFPLFFRVPKTIANSDVTLMTKTMVREIFDSKPLFALRGFTSGTTNQPLTVFRSIKSVVFEEYMFKTFMRNCGVAANPKIAVMRGDMIKKSDDQRPPFWKKMPFTGRMFFSSFHLSAENVPAYLTQLEVEQPDIIMAYPSSITFLAKQAKLVGWKPTWQFYGVFTSSESFSAENQQICREVFGKVFDHYGQAERVAALQQCQFGHYHVRDDYSFVEFVKDENGIKIVGSNYHNSAMKLVRYDTGDYVEGLNSSGDCPCGDKSRYVTRIIGRDDDYVVLPDGRHIGRLDVAFKGIERLLECQLIQTASDTLEVNYVPLPGVVHSVLESHITVALRERLGAGIVLNFAVKDSIPRTKAGKFRSVIRRGTGSG